MALSRSEKSLVAHSGAEPAGGIGECPRRPRLPAGTPGRAVAWDARPPGFHFPSSPLPGTSRPPHRCGNHRSPAALGWRGRECRAPYRRWCWRSSAARPAREDRQGVLRAGTFAGHQSRWRCWPHTIRGWCGASIATGIDGPRMFQHEGLPVGPPWPDVQRLIASTSGDTARDIRDRIILMLLATYGLRSGEVAGLCLEDVNWGSEILAVSRPKQRRAQEYPLVSEVGEAILRYLQQVRPRCARREIFLTLKAVPAA